MRRMRTKIWIDRFQTYLMVRVAAFCVLYQAAVWSLVSAERAFGTALGEFIGPDATANALLFVFVGVSIVGLLFIYDAIKFAHRIVGPLYRLRQTIKGVTAGEEVAHIRFRKGDFLEELRDEFNEMLTALEQRGAITLKPAESKAVAKEAVAV
jgi:hypothetical protein